MNFQNEIPSIPFVNFRDHQILVLDVTSFQDATENCPYPEIFGDQLRLELKFTYPQEHGAEIIALQKKMLLLALDTFGDVGKSI